MSIDKKEVSVVHLGGRADRLGANFTSHIAQCVLALSSKYQPIASDNLPFAQSHIMQPLIKLYSPQLFPLRINMPGFFTTDWFALNSKAVLHVKSDLVTYFRKYLAEQFYNVLLQEAAVRKQTLVWEDSKKIICVHLRLDDVTQPSSSGQHATTVVVTNKINDDAPVILDELVAARLDGGQATIAESQIIKLVNIITKTFPTHEVHVICSPIGACSLPYPIHRLDADSSLWHMINCDVLVMSRSTYSLAAGYLHRGTKVFYPTWSHHSAAGLGSKYDKSEWIRFDDVSSSNEITLSPNLMVESKPTTAAAAINEGKST